MAKSFNYFVCFTSLICLCYLMLGITLFIQIRRNIASSFDELMYGYVEPRLLNTYLKVPWKLLSNTCEETDCIKNQKAVNWKMVTFIKSKIEYFHRRKLLRETWGSVAYLDGARFENVFVVGKTDDKSLISLLDEEEKQYGDILQYDGPDDYRNMPFKVLSAMEWASANLSNDTLYASADDDFEIDLKSFIQNMTVLVQNFQKNAKNFPIVCLFVRGIKEPPMRFQGKWMVSYKEYKKKVYPTYCHGGMYVMKVPLARNLWNASRTAPMLRLDDVWITGILRTRINFPDKLVYVMPEVARHFETVNNITTLRMQNLWRNFTTSIDNSSVCTCTL